MPTKEKTQITTHVPNYLAAKLKELAKAEHRTVSAMLVILIERALVGNNRG